MKKLMIACAVAATTVGAFAGGCGDDDPVVVQDPVNQVYRLSFTGKTTDGDRSRFNSYNSRNKRI